uniref:Integrator complex subunit 10 n=1 Tax=Meleagris gallopavo TaxID=9103 RepID=A0A803YIK3_MELGA
MRKNLVNVSNLRLNPGPNAPNQAPLILLEDVTNVYGDTDIDRNKHIHKKRKLAEGREKTMQSSDDEDPSGKARSRHIAVNKADLANSIEVLESFKLARESWELLCSLESLEKEFTRICLSWKTETWLWLRIFLTDMIIYQGQYKKAISSLHHLAALQGSHSPQQITGQGSLENQRALIQLATCHFALGEYRQTCEKVLDLMCYILLPIQEGGKVQEEQPKVKSKFRKGSDLKLWPCTSRAIMPHCLHLLLACFKLRAFTDNRDDTALGHVIVLLQHEWPRGENLFLKAINKICQQGNFQYENFFNYVTNIDMLEEFAYLRTQEGGKIHLELLPNQGMLIKLQVYNTLSKLADGLSLCTEQLILLNFLYDG